MDALELLKVDLDTLHPNPNDPTKNRRGESPRTAFTKYNELIEALIQRIEYIGPQAPTNPYPHQKWFDTSTNPPTQKRRNEANTGWLVY